MVKLIFSLFLSFFPGIIGMFWLPTGGLDPWYNALVKTPLTPGVNIIFLICLPIIYILLGTAFYLVIKPKYTKRSIDSAVTLFGINMFLSALWNFVFFKLHLVITSAVIILALFTIAFMMQRKFSLENKYAGYLVLPYTLFLIFAFYLNGGLVLLN
ncbi:MAG: tryptophan-rich sensory protein [Alphaproteobacteria bacterium]|nr:tryptophan-rich sensory protein [Alphaproteobacteria bacterium]MBN2675007.1 tryptophan-rich sensory protein [Alphaproteobacteria bacterium]